MIGKQELDPIAGAVDLSAERFSKAAASIQTALSQDPCCSVICQEEMVKVGRGVTKQDIANDLGGLGGPFADNQ